MYEIIKYDRNEQRPATEIALRTPQSLDIALYPCSPYTNHPETILTLIQDSGAEKGQFVDYYA
jgi:hypothetical protein